MRTISQPLKNFGGDRLAIAALAEVPRPLDDAELDQTAAAGGSKGGSLGGAGGSGGTSTVQPG